ncbi:MAG: hypothetical protein RIF33_04555 [Cyclobacteriaceae bacterium]
MSNSRKNVVKDACVLFDLIQLELLDVFFELPYEVFTNSPVLDEILDESQKAIVQKHLDMGNLILDDKTNDVLIFELASQNRGLSFTDCSVIDLAIRKQGILLSSDKGLRKASINSKIEVHGILWMIKVMVEECAISSTIAVTKLRAYEKVNSRAPKKGIKELIRLLEKI